jgi:hypothetical protein
LLLKSQLKPAHEKTDVQVRRKPAIGHAARDISAKRFGSPLSELEHVMTNDDFDPDEIVKAPIVDEGERTLLSTVREIMKKPDGERWSTSVFRGADKNPTILDYKHIEMLAKRWGIDENG